MESNLVCKSDTVTMITEKQSPASWNIVSIAVVPVRKSALKTALNSMSAAILAASALLGIVVEELIPFNRDRWTEVWKRHLIVDRSFKMATPAVWNKLLNSIRYETNFNG